MGLSKTLTKHIKIFPVLPRRGGNVVDNIGLPIQGSYDQSPAFSCL